MILIISIIIGSIFILLGFIGCLLPILPGPPLSLLGLLIVALVKHFSPPLTFQTIVILGIVTILVTILDYIFPSIGAKKYGASKWGVLGSIVGMIAGIFFLPPFGILIGGFVGAVLFELMAGKAGKAAFRAGQGVFLGTLFSITLKLLTCGTITYYFVLGLL